VNIGYKIVSHGPEILKGYRRKSLANSFRFITAEFKCKVRVAMVMVYIAGIAFSVGFFSGVAIS
jgi:hypothetical protein